MSETMTIDEIMQVAPQIQRKLDNYRIFLGNLHPSRDVAGQCLNTSVNMAHSIQNLIYKTFPHYMGSSITIDVGNIGDGDNWIIDDLMGRYYAKNLDLLRNPESQLPIHAWLNFDGILIDLTVLYTLLHNEPDIQFTPQPFYKDTNGACFPESIRLCYRAYCSYDPQQFDFPYSFSVVENL